MDKNAMAGELERLYEKFSAHTLPRWEDLPEIDLYMDQVIALMRKYLSIFEEDGEKMLTPAMVNNYVKMGAVPPPVKKKYSKAHIAHLLIICFLKQILPISMICEIIRTYLGVYSESEMLNAFSSEYEQILRAAAASSKKEAARILEMQEDAAYIRSVLTMKAAAYAGAQCAIAQNLFSLRENGEGEPARVRGRERSREAKER